RVRPARRLRGQLQAVLHLRLARSRLLSLRAVQAAVRGAGDRRAGRRRQGFAVAGGDGRWRWRRQRRWWRRRRRRLPRRSHRLLALLRAERHQRPVRLQHHVDVDVHHVDVLDAERIQRAAAGDVRGAGRILRRQRRAHHQRLLLPGPVVQRRWRQRLRRGNLHVPENLMRALVVAAAALAWCGCENDVCRGVDGTCVALTVAGPGQVDGLRIALSGAASGTRVAPANAVIQSLPVEVALQLQAATSGTLHIDVTGVLLGGEVGTGSADVDLSDGAHRTVTLTLSPDGVIGGPDDGGVFGNDLAPPPDL